MKTNTVISIAVCFFSTILGLSILSEYGPRSKPTANALSSSNSTSSIDSSPVLLANTTVLSEMCQSSCQGGKCNQTATGATTCLTCAPGFTLQDPPERCIDMRSCFNLPWCSSADAATLTVFHGALLDFGLAYIVRTNKTLLPLNGSFIESLDWSLLRRGFDHLAHNGANETRRAVDVAVLINTWITGRIQMGIDTRSVVTFFDDSKGYWKSYTNYQPPGPYAVYLSTLKSRLCTNNWRPSNDSACAAPTNVPANSCSRLTISELSQNGGVCLL